MIAFPMPCPPRPAARGGDGEPRSRRVGIVNPARLQFGFSFQLSSRQGDLITPSEGDNEGDSRSEHQVRHQFVREHGNALPRWHPPFVSLRNYSTTAGIRLELTAQTLSPKPPDARLARRPVAATESPGKPPGKPFRPFLTRGSAPDADNGFGEQRRSK
jgi:hypothetical protein